MKHIISLAEHKFYLNFNKHYIVLFHITSDTFEKGKPDIIPMPGKQSLPFEENFQGSSEQSD